MPNKSLIEFSNIVLSNADNEKSQLIKKLKEKNLAALEKRKKELEEENESCILNERLRLENEKTVILSRQQTLYKKQLTEKRNELSDLLFSEVEKRLYEYTKSPEYRRRLIADLEKAADILSGSEALVYARECDLEFLNSINTAASFTFKACGDDIIGGFTAHCSQMRLVLDCTLKSETERKRLNFSLNSGLIIE